MFSIFLTSMQLSVCQWRKFCIFLMVGSSEGHPTIHGALGKLCKPLPHISTARPDGLHSWPTCTEALFSIVFYKIRVLSKLHSAVAGFVVSCLSDVVHLLYFHPVFLVSKYYCRIFDDLHIMNCCFHLHCLNKALLPSTEPHYSGNLSTHLFKPNNYLNFYLFHKSLLLDSLIRLSLSSESPRCNTDSTRKGLRAFKGNNCSNPV